MQKIIKLMMCFIIGYIGIFTSSINASNKVFFNSLDNVYYIMSLENYNYSDNQYIPYINNKLVYCLEPEKLVYENYEYEIGSIEDTELTNEQLKQIELIGYYGYGYKSHTDYKYYLAAQELIWEMIRPNISLSWVTEKYGGTTISVENEKNEILELINRHYNMPSLKDSSIIMSINESKTFEFNEDFSDYEIVEGDGAIIVDNSIIITTNNETGTYKYKLKKIISNELEDTTIYVLNGCQTLIYTNNKDEISFNFTIEVKTGTLNFQLLDTETYDIPQGDATFEGGIYHIYDYNNNFIKEFVTDKFGKATINNLKFTKYYIKEIKSPTGYNKTIENTDFNLYYDSNKKNGDCDLNIYKSVIKANIGIHKTYGDDKQKESNASFLITNNGKNIGTITTNYLGKVYIKLPYGAYEFKQINGIENHYLTNFEMKISNNNDIDYFLNDDIIKTNLIINNVDSSNNTKIIENIRFKIFDIKNNIYLKNENDYIFYTNNGVIEIENISLGEYIIEQLDTPLGYIKSQNINISLNEKDILNDQIEINIPNEIILKKIEIKTLGIDYYNEIYKLDSISIDIFAKEDIYLNGNIFYKKDELIDSISSNNGIVLSKYLIVGSYYYKQKDTIDGYLIDNNIYEFNINNEANIIKELINYMIIDKIIVNKYGIYLDHTYELNNSTFELYAKEDIIINNIKYYQKDELVDIFNKESCYLVIGNYYLKESKVDDYHYLDEKIYDIDLLKNKEINSYSNMILGSFLLTKFGESNILLDNVKFEIYAKNDIIINNIEYYKKDQLINTFSTTNGKYLYSNLLKGKYYIKEIETNIYYEIKKEEIDLEIINDKLVKINVINNLKQKEALKIESTVDEYIVNNFIGYDIPDTGILKVDILFILFLSCILWLK